MPQIGAKRPTGSKTIVFIDDDKLPMSFYEDAIREQGYRIERIYELSEALRHIQNATTSPFLWLLDLMMPVGDDDLKVDGQSLIKAAWLGLASGRVLYWQIRKRFPESPIILFTNLSSAAILDDLEAEMDDRAWCVSKMAVVPSQLVKLIKKHGRVSRTQSIK